MFPTPLPKRDLRKYRHDHAFALPKRTYQTATSDGIILTRLCSPVQEVMAVPWRSRILVHSTLYLHASIANSSESTPVPSTTKSVYGATPPQNQEPLCRRKPRRSLYHPLGSLLSRVGPVAPFANILWLTPTVTRATLGPWAVLNFSHLSTTLSSGTTFPILFCFPLSFPFPLHLQNLPFQPDSTT